MHDDGHGDPPQGRHFLARARPLQSPLRAFPRRLRRRFSIGAWITGNSSCISVGAARRLTGVWFRFSAATSFPWSTPGSFASTCARPRARASRRPSAIFTQVENVIREVIPAGRIWSPCSTTSACPRRHQSSPSATTATIGPADGEILVSLNPRKAWPDLGLRAHDSRRASTRVSRLCLLHPAVRHRRPDSELRSARADRRADRRPRPRRQLRARPGAGRPQSQKFPARSTCTCTRWSTRRPFKSTSTARAPSSSASPSAMSRAISSSPLSGSAQAAPNFWLSPQNGVQYLVATQTPQFRIDSLDALQNTPIGSSGRAMASPRSSATSRPIERTHHARRSSATTTSSRSSMSTPTSTAAISAAVADEVSKFCPNSKRNCRAAASSRCAARSRA